MGTTLVLLHPAQPDHYYKINLCFKTSGCPRGLQVPAHLSKFGMKSEYTWALCGQGCPSGKLSFTNHLLIRGLKCKPQAVVYTWGSQTHVPLTVVSGIPGLQYGLTVARQPSPLFKCLSM